jgi:hypothetical protein
VTSGKSRSKTSSKSPSSTESNHSSLTEKSYESSFGALSLPTQNTLSIVIKALRNSESAPLSAREAPAYR